MIVEQRGNVLEALAVLVLATAAVGVRLWGLTHQPVWYDEAILVSYAQMTTTEWLEYTTSAQTVGPLYHLLKAPLPVLLLRGWIALAGSSPEALRLPFALIGATTVLPIYLLGRRLLGRRAALLVGGLLALSPFHIYYSQQVSEYGLLLLMITTSMLLWLRGAFAGAMALNLAAVLCHPLAAGSPPSSRRTCGRRRGSGPTASCPTASWRGSSLRAACRRRCPR